MQFQSKLSENFLKRKIHTIQHQWPVLYAVLLVIISLTSCSRQSADLNPPIDLPDAFSRSGQAQLPDQWWTAFNDQDLNNRVDQALHSNFTLKSAWYRLKEARAITDRQSALLFPSLDAFWEGEKSRRPAFNNQIVETEGLSLGLASDYEIDLWGRIRSRIDAEEFRTRATLADYQTAALSLSAEVVRTWIQLVESTNQLHLIEHQIQANEKILQLIETRFNSGQARHVDILRQKQLAESTREQKITIESRIQVQKHRLAVLVGRPPRYQIDLTEKKLPKLPPLPETGVASQLVRRRPDVMAVFYQLKAANQDLATAISTQYPRLTLSASVSTTNEDPYNLFENWAGSLFGNLIAPLFDGGQRSAEVERNKALTQQRFYDYTQTILEAFREVEDALIREKSQVEKIQSLEMQVKLAQQAFEQLETQYFNGVSDYIEVLTALNSLQQLQRDLLSAKMLALEFRIALYRSMAGGFETNQEQRL